MGQETHRKHEDRWFLEQDKKLIEKLKRERERRVEQEQAREAEEESARLKEMHWMRCPKCGHPMQEKVLEAVKVDVCNLCEGIFFDRGELEELMLSKQSAERRGFFRGLMGLGEK
jgi:RNA polymerase-binding transcription factor DksA